MPKVSVIVPTYNCAQYICEAIDSVLRQTYKDYEIIVINDGSTDNTKDVLEPYIEKGLIKYIYQENKGLPGARNTGIRNALGEWIALLDADDEWPEDALERLVEIVKSNPDVEWVVTDRIRVEGENKKIISSDISQNRLIEGPYLSYIKEFLSNNYIFPEVMFFNKKALLDIGLYDESMKIYEDLDLHIRLLVNKKTFIYAPVPTYFYKIRSSSLTRQKSKIRLGYLKKFLLKYENILCNMDNELREILSYLWWDLARQYFYHSKDLIRSTYCFFRSLFLSTKAIRIFLNNKIKRYGKSKNNNPNI